MTHPRISLTCIAERIILWWKANWQYILLPLFIFALLLCLIFCPGNAGADWQSTAHYHLDFPICECALRVRVMLDGYEFIPEATRLRCHDPIEGEIYDCQGRAKSFGDVAISPDIPLDPYAEVKTEIIIYKPGVGWLEGRHFVNDVTAKWKRNMIDLYVPNPYIGRALTCNNIKVWRKR